MDGRNRADPLERARAAAARCGVTRLADLTGLDRLGVPVYQAVRPWSRALSVHQGKSLDPETAQIGALMEAVESDHAEAFPAAGVVCAFADLPPDERAAAISDFALDREDPPDPGAEVRWVEGRTVISDRRIWAPFEVVSLDFTGAPRSRFERSSAGLAAHFSPEAATRTALLEVVERDAVGCWRRASLLQRTYTRLDVESAPFAWFQRLRGRLSVAGVRMSVYRAPAVIPAAVFVCELIEPDAISLGRGAVYGSACRTSPEEALRAALLEAIQSRLTEIVGARDDIALPDPAAREPAPFGFGLPPPLGMELLAWDQATAGLRSIGESAADIARALHRAGYGQAAVVDLSRPGLGVTVVKALAPGLAGTRRSRRPARSAEC